MHFGFALDLSDIDLLNIDLLDQRYTHLDLFVSKTSWRRLQRNNFSSSKTSCERSWKGLQDVLEDLKLLRWRRLQDMSWRPLQDVLKTYKCLLGGHLDKHLPTTRERQVPQWKNLPFFRLETIKNYILNEKLYP